MIPFDLGRSPLPPGLTLLEASAGTGKTWTISRLAVRLLLEGLSMADLLVVTFTRAATAELADRIRAAVREAHDAPDQTYQALIAASGLGDEAAKARLAQALREADLLGVTTIHAFAKRVLEDAAFESRQPFATTLVTDEQDLIDAALVDRWRTVLAESPALTLVAHAQGWKPADDRALVQDFLRFPSTTLVHALDLPAATAAWEAAATALVPAWDVDAFLTATASVTWTSEAPEWLADADLRERTLRATDPGRRDAALITVVRDIASLEAKGLGKRSKADKAARDVILALPLVRAALTLWQAADDLRRAWRTDLLHTLPTDLTEAKAAALARSTDDLLRQVDHALPGPDAPLARLLRERHRVVLIDEFQDTDPVQWRVFHTVFGQSPDHRLVLVGDPKQAIYGFRGGDLGTYTAASAAVPPAQRFTLSTNFRSEAALVADLNAFFASVPAPTFVTAEPAYHAVAPGAEVAMTGWEGPRLRFWTEDGIKKKEDYEGRVATRCIALLRQGLRITKKGETRDLAPGDIALLVGTNAQAQALQDACRQRGLPAVLARSGDVLATDEARDLAAVLRACLAPRRVALVRTALTTRLLGRDAAALRALEADEAAWDSVVAHLADLGRLLVRRGPLPVLDRLLGEADALRTRPDAARRITDLRHLAELAQARHEDGADAEALVRWLSGGGADEDGAEERQRRLESDAKAIQITTLHGSKGLQWPVVVCPYLSEPPKDRKSGWLARRAPDGNGIVDLAPDDLLAAEAEQERVAEQARLLYVALTRAEFLCLAQAGRFFRGGKNSALAWLLRPADQAAWGAWHGDPARRPNLPTDVLPLPQDNRWTAAEDHRAPVADKPLPAIPAARDQTSFSRLTRDADAAERAEDHDVEPPEPTTTETDVLAAFPRGTTGGTALHACLEHWDLATPQDPAHLGRTLAAQGLDPRLGTAVAALQADLAASHIPGLGPLADLATCPRRAELRFTLACGALDGPALATVFAAHGQGAYARRLHRLPHGALPGFCVGAIDLVVGTAAQQWWVIDWKSNRLDRPLENLMEEHHYPLQAQLYLVAVHRLLRHRLPAYDPARHLGGWAYAFLRGLRPGTASGWLAAPADPALTLALDDLLGGAHG